MPGIDGYEVCRRLKADPATAEIPVIFLSALTDTKDKVQGLDLGAVDYVTKPFQPDEVIARVSTHLTIYRLKKALDEKNRELQEANDLTGLFIEYGPTDRIFVRPHLRDTMDYVTGRFG